MSGPKYHPKELFLIQRSCGATIYNNSNTYYKIQEYWWSQYKPDAVDEDAKMWRKKGFRAMSKYTIVPSGTSWNNGQEDTKLYSLFVAVPKKELNEWYYSTDRWEE